MSNDNEPVLAQSYASQRPLRLGVFGGTFDPPHNGHLHVARQVKERLDLDAVAMMVTNISWQKRTERHVTPAALRWDLVQAACADEAGLEPCRLEIDRGGDSFSYETMVELRQRYPNAELFFIVGWDTALKIPTWHQGSEIVAMTELIVVNRPVGDSDDESSNVRTTQALGEVLGNEFTYMEIPPMPISSTMLRDRFQSRESTELMTPESVRVLVQELGLYQPE